MAQFRINQLEVAGAPEDFLQKCHRLWSLVSVLEFPSIAPLSYQAFLERLALPVTHEGEHYFWVAETDGVPLGAAFASYPVLENTTVVAVVIRVAPDVRNQGVGTALLSRVLADARARGRDTVRAERVALGGAGERWARALGFSEMQKLTSQTLVVANVDPAAWQTPVPAGYRLEQWFGACPELLVSSFARARTAIHDAPYSNESEFRLPQWTIARVRENEEMSRATGEELRVVAAVHEDTKEIVGFSETAYLPTQTDVCYQLDTAVLSAHRGHGLGRCVKAAMMRWLRTDRPQIERVITQTDADNRFMIEVNRQIGYEIDFSVISVEGSIADVARRVQDAVASRQASPPSAGGR